LGKSKENVFKWLNLIHLDKSLERSPIKIIDLIGRSSYTAEYQPLLYIYKDGSVEKKIILGLD
tara:strand:+ start:1893 stop:2081 length:189 start_codon:yes stop_codon:yes gene_type:complete